MSDFSTLQEASRQLAADVFPRVRSHLAVIRNQWWVLKATRDHGFVWSPDSLYARERLVIRTAGELHGKYPSVLWTDSINGLRNQWHLDRFMGSLKYRLRVNDLPGRPIEDHDFYSQP